MTTKRALTRVGSEVSVSHILRLVLEPKLMTDEAVRPSKGGSIYTKHKEITSKPREFVERKSTNLKADIEGRL